MPICPILEEEIDNKECQRVCVEAIKEGKGNHTTVAKKFKIIVCWKAICKACRHHKKQ